MVETVTDIEARIDAAVQANDLEALDEILDELFKPAKKTLLPGAPFAPALDFRNTKDRKQITEALTISDAATYLANKASRGKRRVIYNLKTVFGFSGMRIVEEGDSWHQYPVLLDDIIDQLMEDDDKAILSLGGAGDKLTDILTRNEYLKAIEDNQPHVFLLSAGGNDLLGEGALDKVLKQFEEGFEARDVIDHPALETSVDIIIDNYKKIISNIVTAFPNLPILGHGYDLPFPQNGGKWLGAPLAKFEIPLNLGREVIRIIMDKFNDELSTLENLQTNYTHIDLRGVVDRGRNSWHDELHPKNSGYSRAADAIRDRLDAIDVTPQNGTFTANNITNHQNSEVIAMNRQTLAQSLNLSTELIPLHMRNRQGTIISPKFITVHNTSNTTAGADAAAHSKFVRTKGYYIHNGRKIWVSWHYTVDDKEVIKQLPINEKAFHAGGTANNKSIAIETCMHSGINQEVANDRLARLVALLRYDLSLSRSQIKTHKDWTGKNCPILLLAEWDNFLDRVDNYVAGMKEAENQPESFAISSLEYKDDNLEESEINHEALSLAVSQEISQVATQQNAENTAIDMVGYIAESLGSSPASEAYHMAQLNLLGEETENDINEFDKINIGDAPDFSGFGQDNIADRAVVTEMFSGAMPSSATFLPFEDFIKTLNLRYFKAAEFLFLGGSNQSGPCKDKNSLPPQDKWPNIAKTARMLDEIRHRLGAPVRILSCYRSPAYNQCINGASNSYHVKFNAIDWRCSSGTPQQWLQVARAVRNSNTSFKGGIGLYTNSRFIHIDTRGSMADWGS